LSRLGDRVEVFPFDDGRLTFREPGEVIKSAWTLPKALSFPANNELYIWVNNTEMLVIAGLPRTTTPQKTLDVRILDKAANRWQAATFSGGQSFLRGYGPWLAVLTQEFDWPRVEFYNPMAMGIGDEPFTVSPGEEDRRKNDRAANYCSFDELMRTYGYVRPGTLILYNAKTSKQYTLETHQGDSEILLVEGSSVYYRTNRSIWKATIGKDTIGPPTLLAEDKLIPFVHWAFLGPAVAAPKK
jgi:hypothetical protein